MFTKKKAALLFFFLTMILGCDIFSKEAVVSMAVSTPDESVTVYKTSCFISDAAGNRLDTKAVDIQRDKKEFWTRFTFKAPRLSQVLLRVEALGSSNKVYRAMSEKLTAGKNRKTIYLSLEELKAVQEYSGNPTVKVSGSITTSDYKGPVEIQITSKEELNKKRNSGTFPAAARTVVDYPGQPVKFNIDVPVNLGVSVLCISRTGLTEPPFCQDIEVGSSDIQGLELSR